jgi:membrane protein YqaA with SNARE-associated domain
MLSLWALFFSAFGAATLLPLQSEAVLVGLLLRQPEAWATLLLVATLGNVLGSVVNWLLGRAIEHLRDKRWFPFSASQLESVRSSATSAGGSGRCCSAGCR